MLKHYESAYATTANCKLCKVIDRYNATIFQGENRYTCLRFMQEFPSRASKDKWKVVECESQSKEGVL